MESSNVDYANVNILFFAKAKELVKKTSMPLKLPTKFSNVDSLLERVESEVPELKTLNRCFVLALNEEYLLEDPSTESNDIVLRDQDELAIIPPLSGG